jgi:hypothetical protein
MTDEEFEASLPPGSKAVVTAGWDDVPHLDAKMKAEMLAATPEYLRDARSKGIPSLGAGAIYPIPWDQVVVKPFAIPAYYKRAYALDVGWNRTAALWGALDPDTDILYCHHEHYVGGKLPAEHALAIKSIGDWIPGVIDPASNGRSQRDGERLFVDYKLAGLDLTMAENSVEAGIYEVLTRLQTGRLFFFSHLRNTKAEYMVYRRDEKGHIVKENDHLMDDLRYLVVSGLKRAKQKPPPKGRVKATPIAAGEGGY